MTSDPGTRRTERLSMRTRLVCGALILVPVILALSVPLYQRMEPTLFGIPFFYWFQMAMAVTAAGACGTVYLIAFRDEPDGGAQR